MRKKLTLLALFLLVFSSWNTAEAKPRQKKVELGVETLFREHKDLLKGKRVGLITNPTGVDSELRSSVDLFAEDPDIELTALYGPEHGVRGDAQAGDKVDYYMDEKTGLPVYSLYGDTRKPTPEMLKNVDILVFDIQDVGARFYTYIYTMAYAMEAAKEQGIPFVVLDRPNPLGGEVVEGPVLEEEYSSFVGKYPIPLRHGMTVGELAQLFNEEFGIGADLTVVKMKKWKRSFDYDETNLPFVMPSPNMPTLETAFVYPGTGLIEGTNVSEGRGTTKPFELLGAPFINGTELSEKLNNLHLDGVKFRAASFTPSFSKHSGQLSHGVQVYVTDREKYQAVETGLHIVKTIHDLYGEEFSFNKSGNFDLLIGNSWVREELEKGTDVEDIIAKWQKDTKVFKKVRKQYLLY
ncbi:exo-beta-N-acetylmuramidase NamZ family protein [Priestia filamentosa]|uniref:Uncharacterized protein n=1 Tax=Priestia filamentosa TaxID=1402861 RepID=A0A1X7E0X9_9BACI|nr:DUF1343 domain-containing protein [Priestia filamentosa]AKO92247.1 hypothetical protein BEH_09165 [Priestia filamentosa]MDT3762275.1 DUF1343 domain-containing protein [Priestia filamentosa]OXS68843.1 hypothetical protein B1B01_07575 [Priestia filamentosa]RJS64453.1 DUF1343 domain-containing protein [Priestia filamentosa]WRU96760.1 DUF1343 domain-containing protein [Priestia filamentosa]